MKINNISGTDAIFPERLRSIPEPPKRLYLSGELPTPDRRTVAIVGSRKPTNYGRAVTEQLADGLASRGVVIISGLAFGIDSIAHQACLKQQGTTVAVLPSSLDNPYPRSHRSLAEAIVKSSGALISEHEDNPQPGRWDFLSRNRLISGLADSLIVTEAAIHSGTMSTVAHALNQGRDVYAIPGAITSPLSAGCNRLIAQGAAPIIDIEEFIDNLVPPTKTARQAFAYNDEEQRILALLDDGVSDGDELLSRSGLEASLFSRTMTMLEIRGVIHALGANQWRL